MTQIMVGHAGVTFWSVLFSLLNAAAILWLLFVLFFASWKLFLWLRKWHP